MLDPLIYILNGSVTPNKRKSYSYVIGNIYVIVLLYILWYRFNTTIPTMFILILIGLFICIWNILVISLKVLNK